MLWLKLRFQLELNVLFQFIFLFMFRMQKLSIDLGDAHVETGKSSYGAQ